MPTYRLTPGEDDPVNDEDSEAEQEAGGGQGTYSM